MKKTLFIPLFMVALFGCGEKTKTVDDHLHDIDAAMVVVQAAKNDYAKYKDDPNAQNASRAVAELSMARLGVGKINTCWKANSSASAAERFTTANTDHDCLDNAGYKRSN